MDPLAETRPLADVLPEGTRLGRYVISRCLGSGGMGVVYEGVHDDLKKRIAIKILNPQWATQADVRQRFLREGEAAARIDHPHVVAVHDVNVQGETPYLVMDYLEGEDLAAFLAREGRLSPERIADVMLPVISAVAAAHDMKIVHRDLKPENVFLCRRRGNTTVPMVLDFGISKLIEEDFALTSTNALLGTPYFMAPEQARGAKHAVPSSDQFSLGVMLYRCATGRLPFEADSLFTLLTHIVSQEPAPPRTHRADLPAAFEALILRALRKPPEERFGSVRGLGAALLPFASQRVRLNFESEFTPGESGSDPGRPSEVGRASTLLGWGVDSEAALRVRPPGRARTVLWGGLAVLVGVAGVAAWLSGPFGDSNAAPRSDVPRAVVREALAQSPAVVPAPPTFPVRVTVDPPEATLRIDGDEVGRGSFARDFPRDDSSHTLRVEADGYEPRTFGFQDAPPPEQVSLVATRVIASPSVGRSPKSAHKARPRRRTSGSERDKRAASTAGAGNMPEPEVRRGANDALIIR